MERTLRQEILILLAISIRANKKALINLRGDTPYLWKTVSQMRSQSIIKVNKKDEWTIRLTAQGVHELAEMDDKLCDMYLLHSCGNRPGSTTAHKRAQCKASELTAFMMNVGVCVGTDKPQRAGEVGRKMEPKERAFYLMKELRLETEQKVGRSQISRATGIILSPGIDALVYNTQDDVMGLNGSAERMSNYQVVALKQDVSASSKFSPATKSLVYGYDYSIIWDIMNKQTKREDKGSERKRKCLKDAVFDRTITGTDILFVPQTDAGLLQTRLITTFSSADLVRLVFREDEIKVAQKIKGCEAVAGERKCFEMVTMNLTKLASILKVYEKSLSTVGLVCMESQQEVFSDLVNNHGVWLRVIKDEAFEQTLQYQGR